MDLYNVNSPAWLPTLNLGHENEDNDARASQHVARYERAKDRESKRNAFHEMLEQAPVIVTQLIDLTCSEELRMIAAEQTKIATEYVKLNSSGEKAECACMHK